MHPRRALVLVLVALSAAQAAPAQPGPGPLASPPGCSGPVKGSAEDFSPLNNQGASGVWTDNAFTCYQVQPLPAFGYHGHIHARLQNLDTGDSATADADCPVVNLGVSTGTLLDCTYASSSPPLPHGRYQLFVTSTPAGAVPVPVGSWAAQVIMDR